jgi:hypothetical protein
MSAAEVPACCELVALAADPNSERKRSICVREPTHHGVGYTLVTAIHGGCGGDEAAVRRLLTLVHQLDRRGVPRGLLRSALLSQPKLCVHTYGFVICVLMTHSQTH